MIEHEELPDVEPGRYSPPPDQKKLSSSSCLNWTLTVGGGLIFLIGCVILWGGTSIQLERQGDWDGFVAFILLCPTTMIMTGIIVSMLGLLPLVRKRQIENG